MGALRELLRPQALIPLIGLGLPMLPAAAEQPIGHVLDVAGDWSLYSAAEQSDHPQRAVIDQDVPAGAVIRLTTPSLSAFITIVGRSGRIIAERHCRVENCQAPLYLPKTAPEQEGELAPFVERVWRLLAAEPYQISMHRSRGLAPILGEGVAKLEGAAADLLGPMHDAPPGRYLMTRYPSREASSEHPVAFTWNPDAPTPVPVERVPPGLYDIALESAASPYLAGAHASILVLLCDAREFRGAEALFNRAEGLTRSWDGAASPEARHGFLRAALQELARRMAVGELQ